MTKASIPTEISKISKGQSENTNTPPKIRLHGNCRPTYDGQSCINVSANNFYIKSKKEVSLSGAFASFN